MSDNERLVVRSDEMKAEMGRYVVRLFVSFNSFNLLIYSTAHSTSAASATLQPLTLTSSATPTTLQALTLTSSAPSTTLQALTHSHSLFICHICHTSSSQARTHSQPQPLIEIFSIMAKVSPRSSSEGRSRMNVFHPKLFDDQYKYSHLHRTRRAEGRGHDDDHDDDDEEQKCLKMRKRHPFGHLPRENILSSWQYSAINDPIAKRKTSKIDRFTRTAVAKTIVEVVTSVPQPCSIGICGEEGCGKSYFFGLLKKSLDPNVIEDEMSKRMYQKFEKRQYTEAAGRIIRHKQTSEVFYEMEAQESSAQYLNRDKNHGFKDPTFLQAFCYRICKILSPIVTCFGYLCCCYQKPEYASRQKNESFWNYVLSTIYFGIWCDVWYELLHYIQSLWYGYSYSLISPTSSYGDIDNGDETTNTLENGIRQGQYGSESKQCDARAPKSSLNSSSTEYIFVDFNYSWETVNAMSRNFMSRQFDSTNLLWEELLNNIFKKVEMRLNHCGDDSHVIDHNKNFKSRYRLHRSLRLLLSMYGTMFSLRFRALLLVVLLFTGTLALVAFVQHIFISIYLSNVSNTFHVDWLPPRTTWGFIAKFEFACCIILVMLFAPAFNFLRMVYVTSNYSHLDLFHFLESHQHLSDCSDYGNDGLIQFHRNEVRELFLFLADEFTLETGVELSLALFIEDISKCFSCADVDIMNGVKTVLLTLDPCPLLIFCAIDPSKQSLIGMETSSTNNNDSTATSHQVFNSCEYLRRRYDLVFFLPEISGEKARRFPSDSVLPTHDYLVQVALRTIYSLLTYLNNLDSVSLEFMDVIFWEQPLLYAEEMRFRASTEAGCSRNSSDAKESHPCFKKAKYVFVDNRPVNKAARKNIEIDLSKANKKIKMLEDARNMDPRSDFQNFFFKGDDFEGPSLSHGKKLSGGQFDGGDTDRAVVCDRNETASLTGNDTERAQNNDSDRDKAFDLEKTVFRAKTLKDKLNALNEKWKHFSSVHMNDMSRDLYREGITSFLFGAGMLLSDKVRESIKLFNTGAADGLETFCTAFIDTILTLKVVLRFGSTFQKESFATKEREVCYDESIWKLKIFRLVRSMKRGSSKSSKKNILNQVDTTNTEALESCNHGRISELSSQQTKDLRDKIAKKAKRQNEIRARKADLFSSEDEKFAEEKVAKRRARKAMNYVLLTQWSGDSRYLVFSCKGGLVCIVDCFVNAEKVSRELCRSLDNDQGDDTRLRVGVTCVSFSPSTSFLAVGGADGKVALYDATSDWCEICLVDITTPEDFLPNFCSKPLDSVSVTALEWSPDNDYLLIGDNRGHIFFSEAQRGEIQKSIGSFSSIELPSDELPPKPDWTISKAIANESGYTYDMDRRKKMVFENICFVNGREERFEVLEEDEETDSDDANCLKPREGISQLAWSSDMSFIVSARWSSVLHLHQPSHSSSSQAVQLKGHDGNVSCVSIAHSCQWLVSGGEDSLLRIWNISEAKDTSPGSFDASSACVGVLTGHLMSISSVCIVPSDRYIISSSHDGRIICWCLETGEKYFDRAHFAVMTMSFSHDFQMASFACCVDGLVRVCHLESRSFKDYFGENLLKCSELESCETEAGEHAERSAGTAQTDDEEKMFHVHFPRVDSHYFMVQVTSSQFDIISHMNSMMEPFLPSSSIPRQTRIVHMIHAANRYATHLLVDECDEDSIAYLDSRWELFSYKLVQWVYLCEYYPYRMSLILQRIIECNARRDTRSGNQEDQNSVCCEFPRNQNQSLYSFFCCHVEHLVLGLKIGDDLLMLDGPSESFKSLLRTTPSSSLSSKMMETTFISKFKNSRSDDLTEILCCDVLGSPPFSITQFSFNLNPWLRKLISLELSKNDYVLETEKRR